MHTLLIFVLGSMFGGGIAIVTMCCLIIGKEK